MYKPIREELEWMLSTLNRNCSPFPDEEVEQLEAILSSLHLMELDFILAKRIPHSDLEFSVIDAAPIQQEQCIVREGLCSKRKSFIYSLKFGIGTYSTPLSSMIADITLMRHLTPNLLGYVGFSIQPDGNDDGEPITFTLHVVTEHGIPFQSWKENRNHREHFVKHCKQIATALAFLHSQFILHRKVCTSNVLIVEEEDNQYSAVLSGFGSYLSLAVPTDQQIPAPVVVEHPHGSKDDVRGFGIVCWEMWYGLTIPNEVLNGDAPLFEDNDLPPEPFHQIILQCLADIPQQRPSFAEILHHLS